MNNPLIKDFDKIVNDLTILEGKFHLSTHFLNQQKIEFLNSKNNIATTGFIFIRDLSRLDNSSQPYPNIHSYKYDYEVNKENIIDKHDELILYNNSIILAQAYERLETCLLNYLTTIFLHNKTLGIRKEIFLQSNYLNLSFDEIKEELRKKKKSQNNKAILKLIRELSNHYSKHETTNIFNINLKEWFNSYSEVRHAITHSGNIIASNKDLFIIQKYFKLDGYRVIPSSQDVNHTIREILNFSFLIFKSLSIDFGYDWDILEKFN